MVFSSNTFLTIFLPLVLIGYYLVPRKGRNIFLLSASVLFYSWGGVAFLPVLLVSLIVDFTLVRNFESSKWRKLSFILAIMANILLLGYFKYAGFFLESLQVVVSSLGGGNIGVLKVILPIGISFFTFQKMSYVFDVYRGKAERFKSFFNYALYIIMFPQLIAGPIVRFTDIEKQVREAGGEIRANEKIHGFFRFCLGLAKKVLIADILAMNIDPAFSDTSLMTGTVTTWLIIIGYSLQIYFDFSGYSDMAIGIGHMLGYKFPENFNFPYISTSVTDFWKRWHQTLTSWFREYLYIPLGGNRKGSVRTYLNIFIVFLVSGLWHGAAWTFVVWGGIHGIALILERWKLLNVLNKVPTFISILYATLFVNFTWVLFRAESFTQAGEVIGKMVRLEGGLVVDLPFRYLVVLIIGYLVALSPLFFKRLDKSGGVWAKHNLTTKQATALLLLAVIIFYVALSFVHSADSSPFIYFRF